MPYNLERQHKKTIEEAIEVLSTDDYNHHSLISRLNQLHGYLTANEEFKKAKEDLKIES